MKSFKFKILKTTKFSSETERRLFVVPETKGSKFSLDDIKQIYKHLTNELKIRHSDIMMFGQAIDKNRSIKRRNETNINLLNIQEYYKNRVKSISKFVDNFLSLDIYIYKQKKRKKIIDKISTNI